MRCLEIFKTRSFGRETDIKQLNRTWNFDFSTPLQLVPINQGKRMCKSISGSPGKSGKALRTTNINLYSKEKLIHNHSSEKAFLHDKKMHFCSE
jgi:hypothetical protein